MFCRAWDWQQTRSSFSNFFWCQRIVNETQLTTNRSSNMLDFAFRKKFTVAHIRHTTATQKASFCCWYELFPDLVPQSSEIAKDNWFLLNNRKNNISQPRISKSRFKRKKPVWLPVYFFWKSRFIFAWNAGWVDFKGRFIFQKTSVYFFKKHGLFFKKRGWFFQKTRFIF